MTKSPIIRPVFRQIVTLIDQFLAREVEIDGVDAWLASFPGRLRPELCDLAERIAIEELADLSQRPINDRQWAAFRDRLKSLE